MNEQHEKHKNKIEITKTTSISPFLFVNGPNEDDDDDEESMI